MKCQWCGEKEAWRKYHPGEVNTERLCFDCLNKSSRQLRDELEEWYRSKGRSEEFIARMRGNPDAQPQPVVPAQGELF